MQIEHGSQTHPFALRPKGFAAMSRERVQEIASKGGKAAHAQGVAHQFSHDEAVEAGRKGGKKTNDIYGPIGGRRKGRNVAES
jgi:general stress protein YciG